MKNRFIVPRNRLAGTIIGNLLLGIGVGIFKYSGLGNDPFSAMILSLYIATPLSYAVFLMIFNTFIFVVEAILGKKYIGIGTLINWIFVGYVVQFTFTTLENNLPVLDTLIFQMIAVVFGVILASLGVSLYQTSDVGVAPYDSLSLIAHDMLPKVPYFWTRIFFDGVCALIAFFTGGLIGLGTLICAFGLGPIVSFFNQTVSEKLMKNEKK